MAVSRTVLLFMVITYIEHDNFSTVSVTLNGVGGGFFLAYDRGFGGEGGGRLLVNQSPPALFFFFFLKWKSARAPIPLFKPGQSTVAQRSETIVVECSLRDF